MTSENVLDRGTGRMSMVRDGDVVGSTQTLWTASNGVEQDRSLMVMVPIRFDAESTLKLFDDHFISGLGNLGLPGSVFLTWSPWLDIVACPQHPPQKDAETEAEEITEEIALRAL